MKLVILLKRIDVSPALLLVPLLLGGLAAVLEGLSIGLSVPILNGLVQGDYGFITSGRIGEFVHRYIPSHYLQGVSRPLLLLCSVVFLLQLTKAVVFSLARLSAVYFCQLVAHRIRTTAFYQCINFGKQFFDFKDSGKLHAVISTFSVELAIIMEQGISRVALILPVIVYLFMLLYISWKATLVIFALIPVAVLAKPLFSRISEISTQYAHYGKKINSELQRTLSAIITIKSNSTELQENDRFANASKERCTTAVELGKQLLLADLALKVLTLILIGVCGLVLVFIVRGQISGQLASYLVYLYVLKKSAETLRMSGNVFGLLKSVDALIDSILELFSFSSEKYILVDGKRNFSGLESRIEICNLSFFYKDNEPVLHDISFTINRGEMLALVGPSGAGKSTIAQLLIRLYEVPAATIFYDGVDIRDFKLSSLRERTAFVSQSGNLFSDTLRANLTYGVGRDVTDEDLHRVIRLARLERVLENLPEGLETKIGDRGTRISGGEAQRVAIARAMLKDADLYILDEATSALDATTERSVQDALDELSRDKTVVVIAHRFATLKNADRIVTIDNGRIVEEGPLPELLENRGLFAELWKAQELFF